MSKVLVTKSKLDALVDAYNTLTSSSGKQTLDALATAISEIQTGGDPGTDLKTRLEDKAVFDITNSADQIPAYAFIYSKLRNARFPEATAIGNFGFYGCQSLTSFTADKVTSVDKSGFGSSANLVSCSLQSCTILGESAFNGCTSLSSLNLPNVTYISKTCFSTCTSLTRLELPAKVTVIGQQAFASSGITTLIFSGCTSVPSLNGGGFQSTPIASGTGYIYVPDALLEDWKAATNWTAFAAQILPLSDLPTS